MSDEEIYKRLTARWLFPVSSNQSFVEGCTNVALIELSPEIERALGDFGYDHNDLAVYAYLVRYDKIGAGILIPNTHAVRLLEF